MSRHIAYPWSVLGDEEYPVSTVHCHLHSIPYVSRRPLLRKIETNQSTVLCCSVHVRCNSCYGHQRLNDSSDADTERPAVADPARSCMPTAIAAPSDVLHKSRALGADNHRCKPPRSACVSRTKRSGPRHSHRGYKALHEPDPVFKLARHRSTSSSSKRASSRLYRTSYQSPYLP